MAAPSAETGALPPAPSASNAAPAKPAPSPNSVAVESLPEPGQIWAGAYEVREFVGEAAGVRTWKARRCDGGEEVILRAATVTEYRRHAWETLSSIQHRNLLRAHPAVAVGPVQVEVHAAPTGKPLLTWRAEATIDEKLIERFVRQLTEALALLHERGLAHLNVSPESIFVSAAAGEPVFVLGGLENVQPFEQKKLVPAPADPFCAPPEAAGLTQHPAGAGLCAWDWWSLGRVVQTLILGEHVLGPLLQCDASRKTAQLRSQAEALLAEREGSTHRAGAVEVMTGLEPRVDLLLRGLLTSSRDARWKQAEVGRWLKREAVTEYYRLPKNERMFRWRDRVWTVAEVAEQLRTAENWSEAIEQIWNLERTDTLAHFIGEAGHEDFYEQLDEVRKLGSVFALKTLPPETARDALTAVALLQLAGAPLTWRGRRFDGDGLQAVFGGEAAEADAWNLLQALAARPVAILIEKPDRPSARAVTELAEIAVAAESLLRRRRWMAENDVAGRARVLRCALKPLAELREAAAALHERFACTTDAVLEKLFKSPHPSRSELVVLAWIADEAGQRGFLTHAEWASQEYRRLRGEGAGKARALGWLRLARALAAGPLVFARWRALIPAWVLLAAVSALTWPGVKWLPVIAALPVLALLLRLGAAQGLRLALRRMAPEARRWGLTDAAGRCRGELTGVHAGATRPSLERDLEAINRDIAGLKALPETAQPIAEPPRFSPIWAIAIASWVALAGSLGAAGWHAKQQKLTLKQIEYGWFPSHALHAEAEAKAAAAKEEAAADEKTDASGTKISWPFKPGDEAQVVSAREGGEASRAQTRSALEHGRRLVAPYKPETISTLIILRVPEAGPAAVMIFDGVQRQLVSPKIYQLDFAPLPKTWIEVGGKKGIYIAD